MFIKRPRGCSILKMFVVLCFLLVARSLFITFASVHVDDYLKSINSWWIAKESVKAKYPNDSYYVISNIVKPSSIQSNSNGNSEIVICTQTSLNNLHHIKGLARKWDGFISVAVFSFGTELRLALYNILLLQKCSKSVRRKISFHLVYPINKPPVNLTSVYEMDFNCSHLPLLREKVLRENYAIANISYPVNFLRSVALLNSKSEYVLNLDIDFVPSKGMKREMEVFLANRNTSDKQKKLAYVIPCFESKVTFKDPLSKADLMSAVKKGLVRQFTSNKCFTCQVRTNYDKWYSLPYPSYMNASFKVKFRSPYEPFYVADRKRMPLFDARFEQYGVNRFSQLCEAYYSGYDFVVMNNAFVIHDGFKDLKQYYPWKAAEWRKNDRLFQTAFKRDLKLKYPDSVRTC